MKDRKTERKKERKKDRQKERKTATTTTFPCRNGDTDQGQSCQKCMGLRNWNSKAPHDAGVRTSIIDLSLKIKKQTLSAFNKNKTNKQTQEVEM